MNQCWRVTGTIRLRVSRSSAQPEDGQMYCISVVALTCEARFFVHARSQGCQDVPGQLLLLDCLLQLCNLFLELLQPLFLIGPERNMTTVMELMTISLTVAKAIVFVTILLMAS